ncbi:hypothetical protein PVAND_005909 [Polypedilum vanderplanki]|uniref:Apolipoprotein D n=1 Tax=Polypedilum vanderplanki TaxID=319348 RepID=A0A9J6C1Z0_POLVA|nr:hypothetical protein PVAND_005909 [Polypedilum vanderplanki]
MRGIKVCFVLGCLFIIQCRSSDTDHVVGEKEKCPQIEFPKDFNPKKMLGKWYSIEETGKEVSCVFYHFEETRPNHYLGHFHPANITVELAPVNTENIGEGFLLSVQDFPSLDKAVMRVVATDYENYAAVFTCKEFEDIVYPHSAIWSRTNDLSDDKLYESREALKKSFDEKHQPILKKVNQESCSYETF